MEEIIMNPFQREIHEKYIFFVEEAMRCFPKHTGLKIAKTKEPDFKLLIALIFDARDKYPEYQDESMKLCETIAHFSERNTDKSEQLMFEDMLIRTCQINFTNIIDQILNPVLDEETIETIRNEICDTAIIQKIKLEFIHEEWVSFLTSMDIDIEVLIALIMGTDRYINQDKTTVVLVAELAEYANRNIMAADRELFANMYVSEIAVSRNDLLKKFVVGQKLPVEVVNFIPTSPPVFEKRLPVYEKVIVETSTKQTKNKRRISELNQLTELLNKGESFLVSKGPVTKDAGIKRIVIKSCFADVVDYLEKNLPEKATINIETGIAEIIFGKIVRTKKSKYQRVLR